MQRLLLNVLVYFGTPSGVDFTQVQHLRQSTLVYCLISFLSPSLLRMQPLTHVDLYDR